MNANEISCSVLVAIDGQMEANGSAANSSTRQTRSVSFSALAQEAILRSRSLFLSETSSVKSILLTAQVAANGQAQCNKFSFMNGAWRKMTLLTSIQVGYISLG